MVAIAPTPGELQQIRLIHSVILLRARLARSHGAHRYTNTRTHTLSDPDHTPHGQEDKTRRNTRKLRDGPDERHFDTACFILTRRSRSLRMLRTFRLLRMIKASALRFLLVPLCSHLLKSMSPLSLVLGASMALFGCVLPAPHLELCCNGDHT